MGSGKSKMKKKETEDVLEEMPSWERKATRKKKNRKDSARPKFDVQMDPITGKVYAVDLKTLPDGAPIPKPPPILPPIEPRKVTAPPRVKTIEELAEEESARSVKSGNRRTSVPKRSPEKFFMTDVYEDEVLIEAEEYVTPSHYSMIAQKQQESTLQAGRPSHADFCRCKNAGSNPECQWSGHQIKTNPDCQWSGHHIKMNSAHSTNTSEGYTTATEPQQSSTTNEGSFTTCDECTGC